MEKKIYLSCAETAKLLRSALKESFPATKFGVRSKTYAGGASINVEWTDGPSVKQCEGVAKEFEGAYFDSMIDYKGYRYHEVDGKPAILGANFVSCNRFYSDQVVIRTIESIKKQYRMVGNYTVADWKNGQLWGIFVVQNHNYDHHWCLQSVLWRELQALSFEESLPSVSARRVKCVGDENYHG